MGGKGWWLALGLGLLNVAGGPGAAAAEAVTVGAEERQPVSAAASLYRHDGPPLALAEARAVSRAGGFRPLAGEGLRATNFGLTQDEIWLRLPLSTAADLPGRWLLEVGHASLDRVDLYRTAEGGEWRADHSGDRLSFRDRPIPHRNHVFALDLEPATDYVLYLRVASEGTLTVPLTIWRDDALWAHDLGNYAALGLYYGILIALLIYNLFLYLSLRDALYLNYVAFIATLAIGQAGLAGFAGQFLFPGNAWLTHLSPTGGVSLAGFFGALFVQRFLGDTPSRVRLGWFMPAVAAGYAAVFACVVLWSYHLAALSVNLLSLLFAAGALGLGAVSLYHRQAGARFFVLAWVALLTGVIVISLHNLGVLPSNVLTANALLIGSAMEMLLLSLALADRIQTLQQGRDEAQGQALRARQEMVEALRQSERQLEERVVERTRDLERANRDLRDSQAQLEYQAGHDPLTGLVNRRVFDEQLEAAIARADRHGHGLALMVGDLDRFKPINDRLGHAVGDQVLEQVADRLRESIRGSDTVARLGGDEFAVLLEEVDDAQDVETVGEKITRQLSAPIRLEDEGAVRVGMSLGWARYPEDAEDAKTLFRLADHAMYARKVATGESRGEAP